MKPIKLLLLFVSVCLLPACEEPVTFYDLDMQLISEMSDRLYEMANAQSCNGSETFGFVSMGEQLCGKPLYYLAYDLSIDLDAFFELVDDYNRLQASFVKRYFVELTATSCEGDPSPIGVTCENGLPAFVY